jgi:hypothetical protein
MSQMLCWTGEEEYEPTQASHQAHVHSQAQLALALHHLLQQRGVPQGTEEKMTIIQCRLCLSKIFTLETPETKT